MYKLDENHKPIRDGLVKVTPTRDVARHAGLGCDLISTHVIGRWPVFIEIKKPGPPHVRKLTSAEDQLRLLFPGHYFVVQSLEEALRAVGLEPMEVS